MYCIASYAVFAQPTHTKSLLTAKHYNAAHYSIDNIQMEFSTYIFYKLG